MNSEKVHPFFILPLDSTPRMWYHGDNSSKGDMNFQIMLFGGKESGG
jgi:hypothetical protein